MSEINSPEPGRRDADEVPRVRPLQGGRDLAAAQVCLFRGCKLLVSRVSGLREASIVDSIYTGSKLLGVSPLCHDQEVTSNSSKITWRIISSTHQNQQMVIFQTRLLGSRSELYRRRNVRDTREDEDCATVTVEYYWEVMPNVFCTFDSTVGFEHTSPFDKDTSNPSSTQNKIGGRYYLAGHDTPNIPFEVTK